MEWFAGTIVLKITTPQGISDEVFRQDVSFTEACLMVELYTKNGCTINESMYHPYPTQII